MSLGKIEISPDVIIDIIKEIINNDEDIVEIYSKNNNLDTINMIKNIVKLKEYKSVEVELGDIECVIDLGITINYGKNIEDIVVNLQEKIKREVEMITNKRVTEINVTVKRLIKKEKEENNNV